MLDRTSYHDELTSGYASGVLDPAFRLLLETQAALRSAAQRRMTSAETLSGALFEGESPAAMRPDAFLSALSRIDADDDAEGDDRHRCAAMAAGSLIEEILRLPRPVHQAALDAICHGGWAFAGPGLRTLPIATGGRCHAEIIRIEPGWGAPRHSHQGAEFTLVLAGAFSDQRGSYKVGEIAVAGPDLTHSPVAEKGAICYALAVREGDLSFTGALGVLQRLWKQ